MEEGEEGEIEYKSIYRTEKEKEICYVKRVMANLSSSPPTPSIKGRFKGN